MTVVDAAALLDRYDAFLLDAYGVLVDGGGPLPHAAAFVDALERAGKQRLLLSNDASRTPAQVARRFDRFDIGLREDELLTSGMMIAPWVEAQGLRGKPAVVLGPRGSLTLADEAGLVRVSPDDAHAEVFVVCDEAGYDFVPALEATLTTLVARIAAGQPCALALPNPDVLYPKPGGTLGLTAGAAAAVIERGLIARFGDDAPQFTRLGKPHAPIFAAAVARVEGRVLMIGDQLETDVAGARAAGIDVALIETGVGRRPPPDAPLQPTWVLESLALT
ncbi:MAG: HAD hydrolase-like protein [Myxococcota bacterium]